MTLMTRLLGMSEYAAHQVSKTEYGAHICYPALKRLYEDYLVVARREFSSISRRDYVVH